ncbi:winged helix-turn-helix transcriptional regulator [Candidatus Woesearchaeota archaeon]|nr:winged helix-turn-helix transcriptional regulator [Candidatus Woesearchaeota archaeon]
METIFTKAIGNTPKVKVLEFLIEGRELDYSVSDIAEGAGIGRTTLFRIWNDFLELGIVKHTRDIGNAKLYKLNLSNPFVRKIAELFDTLVIEPLNKRKKIVVRGQN